eukprot:364845-Chlamydomonas_euryale.AAC.8
MRNTPFPRRAGSVPAVMLQPTASRPPPHTHTHTYHPDVHLSSLYVSVAISRDPLLPRRAGGVAARGPGGAIQPSRDVAAASARLPVAAARSAPVHTYAALGTRRRRGRGKFRGGRRGRDRRSGDVARGERDRCAAQLGAVAAAGGPAVHTKSGSTPGAHAPPRGRLGSGAV